MTTAARGLWLRPFHETDLELLTRFATDPAFARPFEWTGFRSPALYRRRWEEDMFLDSSPWLLAIARDAEPALGWVTWKRPDLAGLSRGGEVFELGVMVAPEHRGCGVGTEAQRLLVEHLFGSTPRTSCSR